MNVGAPEPALSLSKGLALFQTWEGTLPVIATEGDEMQIGPPCRRCSPEGLPAA